MIVPIEENKCITEYKLFRKEVITDYPTFYLKNPKQMYDFATRLYEDSFREKVYMLYLNTALKVVGIELLFIGSIDASLLIPKEILRSALLGCGDKIAYIHNHPSGECFPSINDIEVHSRLTHCCNLVGIELVDSIIIGKNDYYSFKKEGEFIDQKCDIRVDRLG